MQRRARRHARRVLAIAMLALIIVVSIWTPLLYPTLLRIAGSPGPASCCRARCRSWWRWSAWGSGAAWRASTIVTPFLCAQGWFVLCYAGLGISIWPMIVPPSITIWEAAAPPESQLFLLVGAVILIPIIMIYTGFAYWVFRGKVRPGAHYH